LIKILFSQAEKLDRKLEEFFNMNIMGTISHLRMAKSVLTDLRNRGYEDHASLLFAKEENKTWLDNTGEDQNNVIFEGGSSQAGVDDLPIVGPIVSLGPAFKIIHAIASTSGGGMMEVCTDIGLPPETSSIIQHWLEDGKYILLMNNVTEEQADFLKFQLGDLQGLDDLTFC
jgi:hypothetical protein